MNARTPIMIFVVGVFALCACSRSKDAAIADAGNSGVVTTADNGTARPPIRRHRPHQPREVPDDSTEPQPSAGPKPTPPR